MISFNIGKMDKINDTNRVVNDKKSKSIKNQKYWEINKIYKICKDQS